MTQKLDDSTLDALEALALAKGPPRALPVPSEPMEIEREITRDDLPILVQELRERNWERDVSPERMVQTLRASHHRVAELVARGVADAEVSVLTGRSLASIRTLKKDPAFNELLAHYSEARSVQEFDAYQRLVSLGGTAMEVLQERLEESPNAFTNNELRQLVESTMDRSAAPAKGDPRSGSGKQSGLNVSINFVPARPSLDLQASEVEVAPMKVIEEKK